MVGYSAYNRRLKLIDSLSYSWKELANVDDPKFKLLPGATVPLMIYLSAPSTQNTTNKDSNIAEFCKVGHWSESMEQLYLKMGVEHAYTVTIRFED